MNGHQLKLFHESPQVEEKFMADLSLVLSNLCNDVPWMALEDFPSFFFFYMLSLCLHFITCSHWGQCASQVWGEGLENNLFVFLFFCFPFCVCICFLYLFSYMLFYFCCCFPFSVFCLALFVLFCCFTVLHKIKNTDFVVAVF